LKKWPWCAPPDSLCWIMLDMKTRWTHERNSGVPRYAHLNQIVLGHVLQEWMFCFMITRQFRRYDKGIFLVSRETEPDEGAR
jgi:hypothetical protein